MEQKSEYRGRLYQSAPRIGDQSNNVQALRKAIELRKPYLLRLIDRWIPANREIRILDLGCGYGAVLSCLEELGYRHVAGIEISFDQVASAKQLGIHGVEQGELLDYLKRCKDETFDVILALDVLEHFTKPEVVEICDEIYRLLRQGGKLILHVPNGGGIFSSIIYFDDLTHETAFTRGSIRQLGAAVGFEKIECAEDKPIVHGVKSFVRRILWEILSSFFRLIYIAETADLSENPLLSQNLTAVMEKTKSTERK